MEKRFSEVQIIEILREDGYGGMDVLDAKRLKLPRAQNARLNTALDLPRQREFGALTPPRLSGLYRHGPFG